MVKILIAEDNKRLSDSLIAKLESNPTFQVKGSFLNGSLLLKHLQQKPVADVILMDINMPEMDGITATEEVSKRFPHIKIIMCTVFDDDENLFKSIMAGASGYLLKDEPAEKIHQSISEVLEGGAPMSATIALKTLRLVRGDTGKPLAKETFDLSARELEVLEQLSAGLSYQQAADNLCISTGTIRKHIEKIYRKLQVNSKVEAVQKANKFRLFNK